jgi:hypothetical protein
MGAITSMDTTIEREELLTDGMCTLRVSTRSMTGAKNGGIESEGFDIINLNSREYLENLLVKVLEQLRDLECAPSVQYHYVPNDFFISSDEEMSSVDEWGDWRSHGQNFQQSNWEYDDKEKIEERLWAGGYNEHRDNFGINFTTAVPTQPLVTPPAPVVTMTQTTTTPTPKKYIYREDDSESDGDDDGDDEEDENYDGDL